MVCSGFCVSILTEHDVDLIRSPAFKGAAIETNDARRESSGSDMAC